MDTSSRADWTTSRTVWTPPRGLLVCTRCVPELQFAIFERFSDASEAPYNWALPGFLWVSEANWCSLDRRGVLSDDGLMRDTELYRHLVLEILGACTDKPPVEVAARYTSYGDLKADTAGAVVAMLEPVQSRYGELVAHPSSVDQLLTAGRDRATAFATPQLDAAMRAIGLTS